MTGISISTALSSKWMPAVAEIPMYRKTPNSTGLGTKLSTAASNTARPVRSDTMKPLTRCSVGGWGREASVCLGFERGRGWEREVLDCLEVQEGKWSDS